MESKIAKTHINESISVGDTVRINDGSYLGVVGENCDTFKSIYGLYDDKLYITDSCSQLTGTSKIIKDIEFKVSKTYLNDILPREKWEPESFKDVSRDVIISYNGLHLKTCSKFLKVIKKGKKNINETTGWWASRDNNINMLVRYNGKNGFGLNVFNSSTPKEFCKDWLIKNMYMIPKKEAIQMISKHENFNAGGNLSVINNICFCEFKEEPKKPLYEVGKWYKSISPDFEYIFQFDGNLDDDDDLCGNGFNLHTYKYYPADNVGYSGEETLKATEQEVLDIFKKYIEKNYNGAFEPIKTTTYNETRDIVRFDIYHIMINLDNIIANGAFLYTDGKWAKPVEAITKEEAEKLLGKRII